MLFSDCGKYPGIIFMTGSRPQSPAAQRLQLIEIPARLVVSIVVTASGSVFR